MVQLNAYEKNGLFFNITGLRLENYRTCENITTDKNEIYELIDKVALIYEEKLRWIPVEEKLPACGSDYQIIGKTKPSKFGATRLKLIDIYVWEKDYQIKNKLSGYSHWRYIL